MARYSSAYDCLQSITEGFLVFFSKQSELFEHKGFLYRGEDRLNCGRFYKPCLLPIAYRHFTKGRDGAYLTGNGQEHNIGPLGVVFCGADYNGRPFFCCRLVGKWKRHKDDSTKAIVCHTRNPRSYPIPAETRSRIV